MLPYSPDLSSAQKVRHNYLAQRQGSLFAILPVCTHAERSLFSLMSHTMALKSKKPNWVEFVQDWATYADGRTIFYKVC